MCTVICKHNDLGIFWKSVHGREKQGGGGGGEEGGRTEEQTIMIQDWTETLLHSCL